LAGGVGQGLQSFFPQIVIHEADEPDALVDLFDADRLSSQASAQVDFLAVQTQPSAVGDDDCLVMKRVVEILNALVRAAGRE
jgi:hypothetical protein